MANDKPLDFGDTLRHTIARTRIPEIPIPKNYNLASEFYSRLVEWINDFDSSLDQEYEVGVRLVSFGQTVVFHLDDMGYWNPSLISFRGRTDDGQPVELIQHVSQISILLMKLKRPDPSKPKRKIGFDITKEADD